MDSIKQKIVENAKIKFLQCSYDAVYLTEICRDAGITTGAFYRRFSGKKELIREIVDSAMFGFKAEIKKYRTKAGAQFSRGKVEHTWLSVLVYQYRDEFQIMLHHMSIMEKETHMEEVAEILMDAYGIEKDHFAHIAFKAYLMALIETTLYYKSCQDAENCINKIRKLIGSGHCGNMAT